MAGRVIEAKAVISGEDRLSKVLDGVNKKLRDVGKGAKVSADVDRLNKSLSGTKRQLEALDRINAAQSRLSSARLGLTGARAEADRIGAALATAKQAKDVKAVAALTAQNRIAQRAVAQSTGAVERQASAVADARRAFAGFAIPVENLVAHERALRTSVEQTTAAIRKQTLAQRDRERFAEAKTLKLQRRQEAMEATASRRERQTARATGGSTGSGLGTMGALRGGLPILGPLAVGAEMRREVRNYADLEKAVTSLGVTAEATDGQVKQAMEQFRREGPALGATAKDMARAGELYVAAGLDFDTATGAVAKTVKATKASGGELDDLTNAGIAAMQQFGFTAKNVEQAFDLMAKGGKEGRYELKSMAKDMPSVGAGAKRLGLQGREGLAKTVAALETIREVVGTSEEAANRWENVVQKVFIGETQKNFKKMGSNLEKAIKDGAKKGKDALDVVLDETERLTKGDEFKMAQLFNDQQAQQGIQALIKNRQKFKDMTAKILAEANGTIARDYERVAKTTSEGLERLAASFDRATGRMGEALSPMAGRLAETIDQTLEKLDRGETLLSKWEQSRRAREEAAGRDPDAARKAIEDRLQAQQEEAEANAKRIWGDKRGVMGVLFPEKEEIDEAVRKAREAGLKEKADRERKAADAANAARTRQLTAEMRQGARPPINSPLPRTTVSAMDADETERLGNLTREMDGIGLKAQIATIEARLKRMEGPGFGDFGKAGKGPKAPEFTGEPGSLTRDPSASGPTFGFGTGGIGPGSGITAEVKTPIPVNVTGEVTGIGTLTATVTVTESPNFTARMNGIDAKLTSMSGKLSQVGGNGPGSTGRSSPDAGKGGRD